MNSEEHEFRRAEYSGLRSEIDRRSGEQFQLLSLSLTVFGVIVGISFAKDSTEWGTRLLLLPPILSSLMGLLWLDHDRAILAIGAYVGEELWPDEPVPSFERTKKHYRPQISTTLLGFLGPVLLVFQLPAGFCLYALCQKGETSSVWWLGLSLSLVFLITACREWELVTAESSASGRVRKHERGRPKSAAGDAGPAMFSRSML
jgi:hypothetical protein